MDSNIVPVKKKNGKIRVCVNFRDLNNACPKDDFPLPIIELMGDATTGATYQHDMQKIFDDMLHKNVECYVDDLVVKSRKREDHLQDLRMVFAGRCQPFNRLMKKDVLFVWDKACHNAFESIKNYLANPPILGAPIAGKPLIVYITAQKCSLGALLAQENEENKEKTLYYLSQTLMGLELNYSLIEKTCLALIFSTKKLRHYMQAYTIHLIAHTDPIKVIKGQHRLLGRSSYPCNMKNLDNFPDEEIFYVDVFSLWMMFFDRSTHYDGTGVDVVFVSP
ncbi:Transposon Tf2-2 polyprotein [Vitis vinifera]|uniref:Transposon Tf2-2 polyprotein n=1 Tax=Vitis vinifera TaxID=29760 RepID=A0A438GZR2_VITVI|nr:Transposon Tf2-2 polyprotein [Vitis vinifera]